MRIMLSGVAIEGGGAEQVIQDLARGFAERSHEVMIVYLEGTDEIVPELERNGIECRRLLARRELAEHWWSDITPRCIFQYHRLISKFEPDVIHTHVPRPSMWLALAKRFSANKAPLVYTEHTMQASHTIRGVIAHKTYVPISRCIVCVSQAVRDSLEGCWKLSDGRVRTIYNGVQTSRIANAGFDPDLRSELGAETGELLIANVANVTRIKGQDVLIQAIRFLSECSTEGLFCAIAGGLTHEPQTAQALQQQISDLGLDQTVRMLGRRTDVPDILAAADVFVLSSRQEGMPITILEAMAAAKPVIATDVGGCSEVVVDGETGLIVPPEDPKALAAAIRKLMDDRELAKQMGIAGRRRVEEYFTVDVMVEKHLDVYEQVLDGE